MKEVVAMEELAQFVLKIAEGQRKDLQNMTKMVMLIQGMQAEIDDLKRRTGHKHWWQL